jgi:hypothetical protein
MAVSGEPLNHPVQSMNMSSAPSEECITAVFFIGYGNTLTMAIFVFKCRI